jgi:hypothetical protein
MVMVSEGGLMGVQCWSGGGLVMVQGGLVVVWGGSVVV